MTEQLPDPLVPADVDLRDFAFMPLDVVRLRDSGLTAKASGDEFRAAVLLWCASWHQVPAGSLPDDDDELANICGYSRSRREWAKVRQGAMRGWIACAGGRLYHHAVATKALEAWTLKLASAIGGAIGNARRWNVAIDTALLRQQFIQSVEALRALDPQSPTLRKKAVAVLTSPSPPDHPPESPPESRGESPPESPPDRKGQGQGQGQGQGSIPPSVERVSRPSKRCPPAFEPSPDLRAEMAAECPGIDLDAETRAFRDHTFATARSDWPATWRNWVRKARSTRPTNPPTQSFRERDADLAAAEVAAWTGGRLGKRNPDNVIDMEDVTRERIAG